MAKRRRKTQTQKNLSTYNRYKLALSYYNIEVKELKRPTVKSIDKVKQLWKQNNKKLKKQGFIDLPTVYEASSFVCEISAPSNNQNVTRETYHDVIIDNDTIADIKDTNIQTELDELIDAVMDIRGKRLDINVSKYDEKHLREVRDKLNRQLNYGRQKLGDYAFLTVLKESDVYTRFADIIAFADYYYLESAAIEEQALPLLQSIIEKAVADL